MRLVILLVVITALAVRHVHADAPAAYSESYRRATLATDGLALGLLTAGVMFTARGEGNLADTFVVLGASIYVVGAPVVHVTKSGNRRAAASIAMRVGLPLVGVVIGDALPRDCGATGDCQGPPLAVYVGLGIGIVSAAALDTLVLAKGDTRRSQRMSKRSPFAGRLPSGIVVGIAGRF
jgi:hypothetical protein